jgi:hypothetical protein
MNLQPIEQVRQKMAHRAPLSHLEFENNPEPCYEIDAIFHGLWVRGHPPTDLEYGAPRIRAYDEQGNQTTHEEALDQLDEARYIALLHSSRYQQPLRRYHSQCVWGRAFSIGDLVLRLR